jgi:hypothetical protein
MLLKTISQWLVEPTEKITDRKTIFWLSLSLIYAAIFGIWALRVVYASEYSIQDDARIHVTWLLKYIDPELFPNDLIADYYTDSLPYAYLGLYRLFAFLGIDAITVSKIIPPMIGVGLTIYSFLLAFEMLPVPLVGFLSAVFFNQLLWNYDRIITATPRAFGAFLFLATLYYFFKENRWLFLSMIFLLGGFYQVLLLPLGGVLFLQLFRWKNGLPRGLTTNKKTLWLSLSGLGLILGILVYYALLPSPYGPTITKSQALGMREFQPGGRVQFFYFNPNLFFDPSIFWLNNSRSGLTPDRILKPEILYLSFLLPLLISYSSFFPLVKLIHRKTTIIIQLVTVAFCLFILAHLTLFTLYLPNRYTFPLQYATRLTTPLVLVIIVGAVLKQLQNWVISQKNSSKPLSLPLFLSSGLAIFLSISLLLFPGLFLKMKHYIIEGTEPQLYQFFSQQPKDTMIASLAYEASNIPSFAQRSVLVSREFSHPYELGYYDKFRERTLDLIKAQYNPNSPELKTFIDKYKVNYFLLEKEAFQPKYIKESLVKQDWLQPFTKTLEPIQQQLEQGTIPVLSKTQKNCTVFEDQSFFVLDAKCILNELNTISQS